MKLKILTTLLSTLFVAASIDAKQPIEYYQFKVVEMEEKGDYLGVVKIINNMIDDYDGELEEILEKGYLFNLYQGKCRSPSSRLISNGFPEPRASDTDRNKCLAMMNIPKSVHLLAELTEDLEEFTNKNISQQQKQWAYDKIIYMTRHLKRIYTSGNEEFNIKPDVYKTEKYRQIHEKYEKLRKLNN